MLTILKEIWYFNPEGYKIREYIKIDLGFILKLVMVDQKLVKKWDNICINSCLMHLTGVDYYNLMWWRSYNNTLNNIL